MASDGTDDLDRAEVDQLVKALAARRRAQATPQAVVAPAAVGFPASRPTPQAPARTPPTIPTPPATPPIVSSPASATRTPAPGRRWSTARLFMPAAAVTQPRRAFAFASAMNSPVLRRFSLRVWTEAQWAAFTARMFVALGGVLGAALLYWPYAKERSWGLALYLVAVLLVVATGIWGSKLTWDARLGRAHTIALLTVLWGLALLAVEVLPHIGYSLG